MIVQNEYELTMSALCHVNGARDAYLVIVWSRRTIMTEDIVAACTKLGSDPRTQEAITAGLCEMLDAEVELRGNHGGVATRTLCRRRGE